MKGKKKMSEETTTGEITAVAQGTAVATASQMAANVAITSVFGSSEEFATAWRMSKMLASSNLVPKVFQGKPQDCMIAVDMAARLNMSPFMVLQDLYIVYGKPSFSSKFLIGCINSCGRFSPLNYKAGEKGGIIAYAKSRLTGETLESPEVTLEMANSEGWTKKDGSKWLTMPGLMMRYRAATFFARLYCPDVTFGIRTTDEIEDIAAAESPAETPAKTSGGKFTVVE